MTSSAEQWKATPFPNYEVSNLGRVRRSMPGKGTFAGRLLRAGRGGVGYLTVAPVIDGRNVTHCVHVLVALAFCQPVEGARFVNHRDGNKSNNHATNLEWVTQKQNGEHAAATGLLVEGSRHYRAKLTDAQVEAMREERWLLGTSFRVLGEKYGVSITTVHSAVHGQTYKRPAKEVAGVN